MPALNYSPVTHVTPPSQYERCVQAGALKVEAGEMTASELALFKPPSFAPDGALRVVVPSVAPELFHFQALV